MKCSGCGKTVFPNIVLIDAPEEEVLGASVRVMTYCESCGMSDSHVIYANWSEIHRFQKWFASMVDQWIGESVIIKEEKYTN